MPLAVQAFARFLIEGNQKSHNLTLYVTDLCLKLCSKLLSSGVPHNDEQLQQQICHMLIESAAAQKKGTPRIRLAMSVLHFAERTLGLTLPFNERRRHRPFVAEERRRGRSCGTYGTPDFIAEPMVGRLVRALKTLKKSPIDVLDLSIEAGQFPLTFLTWNDLPFRFYGVDRDPIALEMARQINRFAQCDRQDRPLEIAYTCRDALLDALPSSWPRQFSVIVGNPPWKTLSGPVARSVRERFPDLLHAGQYDAYLAFIARADTLLAPGGYLSYVLPNSFLSNISAQGIRKLLLDKYDILELTIYPARSFAESRHLRTVSFLARKRVASRGKIVLTRIESRRPVSQGADQAKTIGKKRAAEEWRRLPGFVFHPNVDSTTRFLISDLPGKSLKEWGLLVGGVDFARSGAQSPPCAFYGVQARHIRAFHACLRHAPRYSKTASVFETPPNAHHIWTPKVVIQELRYMTARHRLVAAVAEAGTCAVSTSMMFLPRYRSHCDVFAAILNSHLANAWYKLRDIHRAIKLVHLRQLPVPFDRTIWQRLANLSRRCRRMRALFHDQLSNCAVVDEEQKLPWRIGQEFRSFLNCRMKIDEQVFRLYQLSKSQCAAVRAFSRARVF